MRLERFLLRYFPPGLSLEFSRRDGSRGTKLIDLLQLGAETDLDALTEQIAAAEPLISAGRRPQLRRLLGRLLAKQLEHEAPGGGGVGGGGGELSLFKVLRAHILPLTNCAFNKAGDRFITGSYDRTCKLWETATGAELLTLEGHKNVVYAIAFNNPYGDKIVTGSFDKVRCGSTHAKQGGCKRAACAQHARARTHTHTH